jgi:hypothetical protein
MNHDPEIQAQNLSAAWDQIVSAETGSITGIDRDLETTLRQIIALDKSSRLNLQAQDQVWQRVIAGTSELWRPAGVASGHVDAPAMPDRTTSARYASYLLRFAWIVVAGFTGGFLAGIGSRLAMRAAGFLTDDRNRFVLTENGNQVGKFTLGGTIFLGAVAGALGIVTILIYAGLRSRLPFEGWRRSAGFAVLLLLVFGYVLMDPSNEDYHLFGPAWLNVSTFSMLYLLMGFFSSQVYEWGVRRQISEHALRMRLSLRIPVFGMAAVMAGFGVLIAVSAMIVGAPGLIVAGLGLIAWLANRFALGDRLAAMRAPAFVQSWGLMVVPGIIGVILTARGVVEILLN